MCLKAFLGLLSYLDKLELLNCVTYPASNSVHLKQMRFCFRITSHEGRDFSVMNVYVVCGLNSQHNLLSLT